MPNHIVHKQQVTLNLPKQEDAHAFQNRVSGLLRNELSASMEAIFDEMFPTTNIIRIDSLFLDLGKIEIYNFEQEFKTHFIEELRKNLPSKKNEVVSENNGEVLSPEQSLLKAFIYFLENGHLPWYSPVENMINWSIEIITAFSDSEKRALYFFNWLYDNHINEPVILQRLIMQFSNAFLEKLLSIIGPAANETWSHIYSDLEIFITHCAKRHLPIRNEIWTCVFHALLSAKLSENNISSSVTTNSELILKAINLLADHFKVSSDVITTLPENKLKKLFRTNVVKDAFQDFQSLLISREDFKEPTVIDTNSETEIKSTHSEGEETIINKRIRGRETKRTKDPHSISNNKTKETNKTRTNDTSDSSSASNDINIKKSSQNPKRKDIGEEKINEEQENPKGYYTDNQNKDNRDETLLRQQKRIEDETSDKNKKQNNTKQLLPAHKKHTGVIEPETLYVKGSGIVILHYFLSPYFADLELLANGKFKDDIAHQRAVLLLYYLATGKSKAAEFDLTLSKILCGYPIAETLPAAIILTRKEKTESKRLLEAVIDYWTPLKNTSIKGLRNAFFERDGKLSKKENGWLLTVEQKTIDVLLGKLPWGYSTIRLSWMQEILNVDWY